MFHGECRYPMMMHLLHLNSIILFKWDLLPLMWKTLQYLHLLESICRACYIEHGINILRNIHMFHGECKYPMMMYLLHLNSIILLKWDLLPSMWKTLQYLHLLESICRACCIEHGIRIFLNILFVSWFKILLQYDVNIVFLLGFGMAMQNLSKFEKICYFWNNL